MAIEIEEWRPVVGWEDRYEVSNLGCVRSKTIVDTMGRTRRGRVLKQVHDGARYLFVGLHRDGKQSARRIHVLVLEAFHGPRPEGFVARHLDGKAARNHADNLGWSTQYDNIQDKRKHGTWQEGETHHRAKFSDEFILDVLSDPRISRLVAARFGIAAGYVNDLRRERARKKIVAQFIAEHGRPWLEVSHG